MSICVLKWGAQCSVRRGRAKQVYLNFAEREQVREMNISQLKLNLRLISTRTPHAQTARSNGRSN